MALSDLHETFYKSSEELQVKEIGVSKVSLCTHQGILVGIWAPYIDGYGVGAIRPARSCFGKFRI